MGRFIKGEVVVIPFPFSDLSNSKKRPALVIADLQGDDIILCQITSAERHDSYSIHLSSSDFDSGGLNIESKVRPNKIFTADSNIIISKKGKISSPKIHEVIEKIIDILKN